MKFVRVTHASTKSPMLLDFELVKYATVYMSEDDTFTLLTLDNATMLILESIDDIAKVLGAIDVVTT